MNTTKFEDYSAKLDRQFIYHVECYIVKNGICVARSRIQVPINVGYVDHEHLLLNGQE